MTFIQDEVTKKKRWRRMDSYFPIRHFLLSRFLLFLLHQHILAFFVCMTAFFLPFCGVYACWPFPLFFWPFSAGLFRFSCLFFCGFFAFIFFCFLSLFLPSRFFTFFLPVFFPCFTSWVTFLLSVHCLFYFMLLQFTSDSFFSLFFLSFGPTKLFFSFNHRSFSAIFVTSFFFVLMPFNFWFSLSFFLSFAIKKTSVSVIIVLKLHFRLFQS